MTSLRLCAVGDLHLGMEDGDRIEPPLVEVEEDGGIVNVDRLGGRSG